MFVILGLKGDIFAFTMYAEQHYSIHPIMSAKSLYGQARLRILIGNICLPGMTMANVWDLHRKFSSSADIFTDFEKLQRLL